jgi:hypothetical protein
MGAWIRRGNDWRLGNARRRRSSCGLMEGRQAIDLPITSMTPGLPISGPQHRPGHCAASPAASLSARQSAPCPIEHHRQTQRMIAKLRPASERHGTHVRCFAQWMPRWMLAPVVALSRPLTPPQIWRPDGENVASAGIEPATRGWYVIGFEVSGCRRSRAVGREQSETDVEMDV